MANVPRKTQLPVASCHKSQVTFTPTHVTTLDWMRPSVSYCMEYNPKFPFTLTHKMFTRLEPLAVPTFGEASVHHRAFFVPMRTVWPAFIDFEANLPHVYSDGTSSVPTIVPLLNMSQVIKCFIGGFYVQGDDGMIGENESNKFVTRIHPDDVQSTPPDFEYFGPLDSGDAGDRASYEYAYFKFTNYGCHCMSILRQLGYGITFDYDIARRTTDSLLPFLCLMRVYLDYYYSSQYANDEDSAWILHKFTDNVEQLNFDFSDLRRSFEILTTLVYGDDFFVNAWDNPNGPNTGLSADISLDIPITSDYIEGDSNEVYVNSHRDPNILPDGNGGFTQYGLNALKGLTDYIKRNQISGSRAIDRYSARYGLRLTADKLSRSYYIGETIEDIQFGDVTSTASTEGATLGDYAGKGLAYANGNYDFNFPEWGFVFIISTVVPKQDYYQGVDRHIMHLTRFDFFTDEFDNLGSQALSKREVYCPLNGSAFLSEKYNDEVFGFVPRYGEYKIGRSRLTGNFLRATQKARNDAWTLFRDVEPIFKELNNGENFIHSPEFIKALDRQQYNRIFTYTDEYDNFNCTHMFTLNGTFPGKSLYDTYDFKDEDEAPKTTVDVNGTTMN